MKSRFDSIPHALICSGRSSDFTRRRVFPGRLSFLPANGTSIGFCTRRADLSTLFWTAIVRCGEVHTDGPAVL
jgi:hypothetical protein